MKLNAFSIATDGTLVDPDVKVNITISLGDLILVDREFVETDGDLAPAVARAMHTSLNTSADYQSFDVFIDYGVVYVKSVLPTVTLSLVSNGALTSLEVHSSLVDIAVLQTAQRFDLMKDYLNWAVPTDKPVVDIRMMNVKMPGERS